MTRYYDWRDTFTFDADITMVIGSRDVGKTFGLREQLLRDWLERGERFVALTRYRDSIPMVSEGYFLSILQDTEDEKLRAWIEEKRPVFKMEKLAYKMAYESDAKPKWETIGYFAYLSVMQASKQRTFVNVRRIVMDEAIIEPQDLQYHRYLPNEWDRLQSVVTSCSKSRTSNKHKVNVYLLANAVDLLNQWFAKLNIYAIPPYGRKWHRKKTFLLDYVNPADYATKNDDGGTTAARMSDGEVAAYSNAFDIDQTEFIEKKPRGARYECSFIYAGKLYGVWTDWARGLSYVCGRILTGHSNVYALTTKDNRVNYLAAQEAKRAMRVMIDRYGLGIVRFESVELREGFLRMMRDFGVK